MPPKRYQLIKACVSGNKNLALSAIQDGANNWNRGLIASCAGGHKELAELMIGKGANNFDKALKYTYNKDISLLLIKQGANISNCTIFMMDIDIEYLIKSAQIAAKTDYKVRIEHVKQNIKYAKGKLDTKLPQDLSDLCYKY